LFVSSPSLSLFPILNLQQGILVCAQFFLSSAIQIAVAIHIALTNRKAISHFVFPNTQALLWLLVILEK
jgi:hypothetical protein